MWAFNAKKYWCWNGYKITYQPAPEYWGSVTATGSIGGWKYSGTTGTSNHLIWPQPGGGFWGTVSTAQGHFEDCPIHIGCGDDQYPRLEIAGWADGTYSY